MADSDKDVDGKGADAKDVDGKSGDKDVDGKGGLDNSGDLVAEILSRATALGGFLVVSIVAPLPRRGSHTNGNASRAETPPALAAAAEKAAKLDSERKILAPDVQNPAPQK